MDEQGKVADPEAAPVVDTAAPEETPAETAQPSPEETRVSGLETKIASLQAELATVRADSRESGSRAQSTADKHASRLEKRIERLSAALEQVAALNMDEPSLRVWKAQQENERLRESITEQSSEVQIEKQRADFQTYSATVLGEEGINAEDPVLKEAWSRYAAQAKDPSDWKAALGRAIAEVRKAEAKSAVEKAATVEKAAREDERNKIKNKSREQSGPVDNGSPGSQSHKPIREMTEEEFALYDAQRTRERQARQAART